VADDGRVDEDEQRFGDERAEGRDGEGQYLPVHARGCVSDR
jgi:hypothetical protein